MPPEADETALSAAPSPADAPDVKVAEQAPDNAQPSSATGEPEDTLSLVRDVVDAREKPTEAASPAEGQEDGPKETESDSQPERDDENFSDVPFHKHPRFQQLLRKAKENETDAVRYRNVQGYLDEHGLNAEEASNGLVIMALAKTNPVEAVRQLEPWLRDLYRATGEILPQDLQQRLQAGELTRDAAIEVSRARAQAEAVQRQRQFEQQRMEQTRQHQAAQSLYDTAAEWEADRRTKDPNFEAKLVPLQKELLFLQSQEGRPSTREGVRDQLKRAYEAVNASLPRAQAQPQRREVRPVNGGQVSGHTRPEPESLLDVVRANRGAA